MARNTIQWPERAIPFSMSKGAAKLLTGGQTDRQLVISFLHWNGQFTRVMNADEQHVVRCLADGFGQTRDPDLVWDWSHIRDSTSTAYKRMARAIRAWVKLHTV